MESYSACWSLSSEADLATTFLEPLMKWKTEQGLDKDASYNLLVAHADCRVVLMTKFDPADYRGYLEDEIPLDKVQPIKVFAES